MERSKQIMKFLKNVNQINKKGIINKKRNNALINENQKVKDKEKNNKKSLNNHKHLKRYFFTKNNNLSLIIAFFIFSFILKLESHQITEIEIEIGINEGEEEEYQILGEEFEEEPSEIIYNEGVQYQYYNNKILNNVILNNNKIILKWNYSFTSCSHMFEGMSNIIMINFSKFNSTNVQKMDFMFCGCTSLISIYFNEFSLYKL